VSQILQFTTDVAPPEQRLALFRAGAVDYVVDAVDDPLDFSVAWRLLVLGEINIVDSVVTPVRYRRSPEMIEQDGKDRISILYVLSGGAAGYVDDVWVEAGPGDALIFDLLRTLDVTSGSTTRYLIVTLPRHLVEEVLPQAHFDGRIAASDRLRLAFDQIAYLIERAAELEEESIPHHVRAVRDLLAIALMPGYRSFDRNDPGAPLLRRISDVIDEVLAADHTIQSLARALDEPGIEIGALLDRFGGLDKVVERRRLLAAYRRLSDPSDHAQVGTIADACGFSSRAEFGRRFREVFGCTPRDLRTQHAGQLPQWAGAYRVPENYGSLLS
jgi:AraC-like DNA-binding protein